MAGAAYAQSGDVAFGIGSLVSTGTANSASFTDNLGGGVYPSFSGDYLIKHHFGVQGEVSWRATQKLYGGFQPYRPIFFDFNAIYAPEIGKRAAVELMAGIGAENLRFYQSQYICGFTGCTNYTSENHFMGHIGGGLKLYVFGNVFVRPEAHLYLVHNNFEFTSNNAARVGVSIGYTFR